MIEIGGNAYHLDFTKIQEVVSNDDYFKPGEQTDTDVTEVYDEGNNLVQRQVTKRTYQKEKLYDVAKFDIISRCIDVILTQNEDIDNALGYAKGFESLPINFKFAFNTLLRYGIIQEI